MIKASRSTSDKVVGGELEGVGGCPGDSLQQLHLLPSCTRMVTVHEREALNVPDVELFSKEAGPDHGSRPGVPTLALAFKHV